MCPNLQFLLRRVASLEEDLLKEKMQIFSVPKTLKKKRTKAKFLKTLQLTEAFSLSSEATFP